MAIKDIGIIVNIVNGATGRIASTQPSHLSAGLRDVQFAEACCRSVAEKKLIELGEIAG